MSAILAVSAGLCSASLYSPVFSKFQVEDYWIMCILGPVGITIEMLILFKTDTRKPPVSYILFVLFTICYAYLISFICSLVGDKEGKTIVLVLIIMCVGVTVAATGYALIAKKDFSIKWATVCVVGMCLVMLMIFGLVWPPPFQHIPHCTGGALLFGLYLIIYTWLALNVFRSFIFTFEEFIAAAMSVFVGIIQIPMHYTNYSQKRQ